MLWRSNRKLMAEIERYLVVATECVESFSAGVAHYVENGIDSHLERVAGEVDRKESDADVIRREVELEMFSKSLLPESREDLLLIIERLDLVPNQAQEALRMILTHGFELPPAVRPAVRELAQVGMGAFALTVDLTRDALGKAERVQDLTRQVYEQEHVGDRLEHQAIRELFRADYALAEKMLYRDLVQAVGAVCDFAEDVAQLITVFVVKRQV
jgi:predicted phosphate transport protein (TIGR00153 family)